jgi:hypothetical protein
MVLDSQHTRCQVVHYLPFPTMCPPLATEIVTSASISPTEPRLDNPRQLVERRGLRKTGQPQFPIRSPGSLFQRIAEKKLRTVLSGRRLPADSMERGTSLCLNNSRKSHGANPSADSIEVLRGKLRGARPSFLSGISRRTDLLHRCSPEVPPASRFRQGSLGPRQQACLWYLKRRR